MHDSISDNDYSPLHFVQFYCISHLYIHTATSGVATCHNYHLYTHVQYIISLKLKDVYATMANESFAVVIV